MSVQGRLQITLDNCHSTHPLRPSESVWMTLTLASSSGQRATRHAEGGRGSLPLTFLPSLGRYLDVLTAIRAITGCVRIARRIAPRSYSGRLWMRLFDCESRGCSWLVFRLRPKTWARTLSNGTREILRDSSRAFLREASQTLRSQSRERAVFCCIVTSLPKSDRRRRRRMHSIRAGRPLSVSGPSGGKYLDLNSSRKNRTRFEVTGGLLATSQSRAGSSLAVPSVEPWHSLRSQRAAFERCASPVLHEQNDVLSLPRTTGDRREPRLRRAQPKHARRLPKGPREMPRRLKLSPMSGVVTQTNPTPPTKTEHRLSRLRALADNLRSMPKQRVDETPRRVSRGALQSRHGWLSMLSWCEGKQRRWNLHTTRLATAEERRNQLVACVHHGERSELVDQWWRERNRLERLRRAQPAWARERIPTP